jgi:putative thioredoxin
MTDDTTLVYDVDEAEFPERVLRRSAEVPVVVDFWAAWCGPCRTLGPMLERAVAERGGAVELAKVDVDRNQSVAQTYRVQGIPTVLGIRDGQVVAQFTGAVSPQQLDDFLDRLVPSPADEAVARARALTGEAAEAELRTALEHDPGHREAAIGLAELLVDHDPGAALDLVRDHRPDPAAEAVVTRAKLAGDGDVDLDALRAAVDGGDGDGATSLELGRGLAAAGQYEEALERLLTAVELGGDTREPAREQVVALFNVLGDGDERVRRARPRLARALF